MKTQNKTTLEAIFDLIAEEERERISTSYYGAISGALREIYTDKIKDLIYIDNPFLKTIEKDKK